jgi:PIN domain nuclease of toxin-antitoxin system
MWLNSDREKLPPTVLRLCEDPENRLYLSSITVWEIAVKHFAGRLPLPVSLAEFISNCRDANGVIGLALREEDIFCLAHVPRIHKDPFDRMLICQAISRGLTILTPDALIRQYPVSTAW